MAWVNLVWLALLVWAACGAVIYAGRKLWSLRTTLRVHLVAAPIFAFLAAAFHAALAPAFDPLLRAAALVGIIVALDAFVIAPLAAAMRCSAPSWERGCHSSRCSRPLGSPV